MQKAGLIGLTEEPYSASFGNVPEKQIEYQEAVEGKWGCARGLRA